MSGESLQQKVRAAKQGREALQIVRVPIPGYRGMLVGVYGLADWQTRVEINLKVAEARDNTNASRAQLLYDLAVQHLLASTRTVEAVDGDETTDLGVALGLELAGWLGVNEATDDGLLAATDADAVALVVEDGEDVIGHFNAVLAAQNGEAAGVDEQLVGESVAAS